MEPKSCRGIMERWEILGYVAAVFNPVPAGLLAAYFLKKEEYKQSSKWVAAISIVWFLVVVLLLNKFGPVV